ncbi:PASTA domain-containing protein [Streptomyces griseus]|uniref:PASTA domain-containing protein n=1 Tax=Streptomyces griseus TaxID=1911 RepID=UPI001F217D63|nr:PASTA domain-containing protein [Streptomyces griseus]
MRTRIISAALLCTATVGIVACQPTDTAKPSGVASPSATAATSSAPADAKPAAKKANVPNFVGMGLQSAQDKAQELGFYGLTSHDALGRDRMQAFDRNWKVCNQNPAAGKSVSTDTTLDFGAVKLEETCPARDEKPPAATSGKMPDFKGKAVKVARAALDSSTSITVKDASAEDRMVLVESNWQVCSQTPASGTKLNGQPVTFTAVKFGESCP